MDAHHLNELRRQRALVAEHLAWLDREIAIQTTTTPPANDSSPLATPAPSLRTNVTRSPLDPEKIIAQYAPEPGSSISDIRRGCFIVFFGAFAVLGLAIAAYFYFRTLQ